MRGRVPWCRCRRFGPWHTWEPGEACAPSHDTVHYLPEGERPKENGS